MNDPLITVGMVVYNGEEFLAEAIQSFLDQTFRRFELVIWDNASTDRTAEIAGLFARRDARVSIRRHENNIGGLWNFIAAAEGVHTPYFCWAAHDDLRDPQFFETLIDMLEKNPQAGLAACGSLEIDPDGTPRTVCDATANFKSTIGLSPPQRLRAYLRRSPCSPIYGLFRTAALRPALEILRHNERGSGGSIFGGDLVFLAGFIKAQDVMMSQEPLLMLRGGGVSHRPDAYRSLADLISDLRAFNRRLRIVCAGAGSLIERVGVMAARWKLMLRYLTWPPVLRLLGHQLRKAMPITASIAAHFSARQPEFIRLRRRASQLAAGSRVVIFGGGKHTRRMIGAIQLVLRNRAVIVAVCDDKAPQLPPIEGLAMITPDAIGEFHPHVLLISTDAYEPALYRRASAVAGSGTAVWCIYDPSLESHLTPCESPRREPALAP